MGAATPAPLSTIMFSSLPRKIAGRLTRALAEVTPLFILVTLPALLPLREPSDSARASWYFCFWTSMPDINTAVRLRACSCCKRAASSCITIAASAAWCSASTSSSLALSAAALRDEDPLDDTEMVSACLLGRETGALSGITDSAGKSSPYLLFRSGGDGESNPLDSDSMSDESTHWSGDHPVFAIAAEKWVKRVYG
jgi:hypothetical protein